MRILSFLSLIAVLTFSSTSCTDQIVGDQFKTAELSLQESEVLGDVKAPKVYVTAITPTCSKFGATATIVLGTTEHFNKVHVELYSEAGVFVDRWTKLNPSYANSVTFNHLGTPANGAKDCSILTDGTTYRVRAYGGNSPEPSPGTLWNSNWTWPAPGYLDELTTIKGCYCTF